MSTDILIYNEINQHMYNYLDKYKDSNYIDIGLEIWQLIIKYKIKYNLKKVSITYQNQDKMVLTYDNPNGMILKIPIEKYEEYANNNIE